MSLFDIRRIKESLLKRDKIKFFLDVKDPRISDEVAE